MTLERPKSDIWPKALVEQLVIVEQRAVWFKPDGLVAKSLNREMIGSLIVPIVAQNKGQMVGTFFIEIDDATMDVSMQDGQSHVWFTIGFHIPDAILAPMVVVAPLVDLWLTTEGDAVDIATEYLTTIDQQLHVADAVVVVDTLCIVVGPQGKAYPAPCGELTLNTKRRTLNFCVGLSETKGLLVWATIEHTLALHRHSHKRMRLRGYCVSNQMAQEYQGVAHHPRLSIVNLQMKMGTCGVARIATDGYQVASLDGELCRWQNH